MGVYVRTSEQIDLELELEIYRAREDELSLSSHAQDVRTTPALGRSFNAVPVLVDRTTDLLYLAVGYIFLALQVLDSLPPLPLSLLVRGGAMLLF